MTMKFIAVLLLTTGFAIHATKQDNDILPWSDARRLTWDDFKARPDNNSTNAALTSSGIEFKYGYSNNKFTYTINCMFEKNKSWGKVKTDYILAHEQGHFDISEIHARKLNKALKAYSFNMATAAKNISAVYEKLMKEQTDMQNMYDDETNYSRNKQQQAAWVEKIKKELGRMKEFANYR
jgi:FtsZ-binding cell division protein ZapB